MSGEDSGADFDPVDFLERAVRTPSHEDVEAMRALLVEELDGAGERVDVDDAGNVVAMKGGGGDGEHGDTGDGDNSGAGEDDDGEHGEREGEGDDGGDDSGRHVALNTHIDTVTPHVPFERDGEVVRGRGACDAKGPLAALLAGFLWTDPGADRLTLAVTPDEETRSTGAHALELDADCYVVGEPTGLDVCTAAKGRLEGAITLTGETAHAAEPGSGANAIAALEAVLGALRSYDDDRPAHDLLGEPTLTPTVVEGGGASNQVPDRCRLTVDRRSVPPETAEAFAEGLSAHLRAALEDEGNVDVDFALTDRPTPFLEAWETDPEHELVGVLSAAAREATDGAAGEVRPFTAATEASYFAPAPVVVFGPGVLADEAGAVAHSEREYVRVPDVRRAADAVTAALDSLVG